MASISSCGFATDLKSERVVFVRNRGLLGHEGANDDVIDTLHAYSLSCSFSTVAVVSTRCSWRRMSSTFRPSCERTLT